VNAPCESYRGFLGGSDLVRTFLGAVSVDPDPQRICLRCWEPGAPNRCRRRRDRPHRLGLTTGCRRPPSVTTRFAPAAITDFLPGTRRLRRKGVFRGRGISGRFCRKRIAISINLLRLRATGSRSPVRARHKGGPPGSLETIGAAGQGTRQRHRHDVASRRPASVITLRDCTVEPADYDGPPGIVGAVPRLSPRHRCCVLPAIAAPRCGQPPRPRQRRRWFEAAHLGRLNSKSRILVRVCAEGVRAGDHGLWIHHS
jgi:hypothetical protein